MNNSSPAFSLTIQPNDQRRPKKPARPPREKRETKQQKAAAAFYSRCVEPANHDETVFRHRHWWEKRQKVRTGLIGTGINTFALDSFDNCGSACQVQWSETLQKHRLSANYCHNRHCEPCARAKANRLAANLKAKLQAETKSDFRFVTLTIRHSDTPLADQLKFLIKSFKTLRNQPLWKQSQTGGAFTIEVKWTAKTRRWHPHLHIITAGGFMRQKTLANEWKRITKTSDVVDIRALKDGHDAAHYVAKYVAKGTSNEVWSDTDAAQEWITATKGMRTCATFGTWRGYKLMKVQKLATDWKPLCSLTDLLARVAAGEEHAIIVLLLIRPPGDTDAPERPRTRPQQLRPKDTES